MAAAFVLAALLPCPRAPHRLGPCVRRRSWPSRSGSRRRSSSHRSGQAPVLQRTPPRARCRLCRSLRTADRRTRPPDLARAFHRNARPHRTARASASPLPARPRTPAPRGGRRARDAQRTACAGRAWRVRFRPSSLVQAAWRDRLCNGTRHPARGRAATASQSAPLGKDRSGPERGEGFHPQGTARRNRRHRRGAHHRRPGRDPGERHQGDAGRGACAYPRDFRTAHGHYGGQRFLAYPRASGGDPSTRLAIPHQEMGRDCRARGRDVLSGAVRRGRADNPCLHHDEYRHDRGSARPAADLHAEYRTDGACYSHMVAGIPLRSEFSNVVRGCRRTGRSV